MNPVSEDNSETNKGRHTTSSSGLSLYAHIYTSYTFPCIYTPTHTHTHQEELSKIVFGEDKTYKQYQALGSPEIFPGASQCLKFNKASILKFLNI